MDGEIVVNTLIVEGYQICTVQNIPFVDVLNMGGSIECLCYDPGKM